MKTRAILIAVIAALLLVVMALGAMDFSFRGLAWMFIAGILFVLVMPEPGRK